MGDLYSTKDREQFLAPVMARFGEGWPKSVDIDDGWVQIIVDLDRELAEIDSNYTIGQIKEKFGGLRFYLDSLDPGVAAAKITLAGQYIDAAEAESWKTCERCSSTRDVTTGTKNGARFGWIVTWCLSCREDQIANDVLSEIAEEKADEIAAEFGFNPFRSGEAP